jgi:hypothetical protein
MRGGVLGRLLVAVFLWAAFAGCGDMARQPICQGNLGELKGKWDGRRIINGRDYRTESEIHKDTTPPQGGSSFTTCSGKT